MRSVRLFLLLPVLALSACATIDNGGTIAQLRGREIEIREERIEGGLEKAMASYHRFLEQMPDSALVPEAIRRLADLKVEKEYGLIANEPAGAVGATMALTAPQPVTRPAEATVASGAATTTVDGESTAAFEQRATDSAASSLATPADQGSDAALSDLEKAGPLEAITLYQKLIKEYPLYERNDQVLYQMSRAYEELGRIDEAMAVMNRLVAEYPRSRYLDEVQFRRAEYFFPRKKYIDAEEAYGSIVRIGVSSNFYQLALYKLGWTFYKQELYEDAQHKFIALLDYKVAVGYDFDQTADETERKRMEDTYRVISLGFSYLGGAEAVVDYFNRYGNRSYEHNIYGNLAEYYYGKRRYSDAVATYTAFVDRNAFHRVSPLFHMRIIDINMAGGFPTLVVDAKKAFATNYGLKAEYWHYFEPGERPEVLSYLKTNLTDLANHYHALYQNPKFAKQKPAHFDEALHWYREFLGSFSQEVESPVLNYQLADLLLENRSFAEAAVEYEKTAYDYPAHDQDSKAGYAAVYAYRQHLAATPSERREPVKREVVRSSLKFVDTFPEHEKAAVVLGAAADDLYALRDFEPAQTAGRRLIESYPTAEIDVLRSAWLVVAHASYELEQYSTAEPAYVKVLELLPENDKARQALIDNLAAAIYKQGEQASGAQDYLSAAEHFLRVSTMAPTSKIRPTAEYDAAAALIRLQAWPRAAEVLLGFRNNFPGHELQPEVTKKIAYVYREDGKLELSAAEFERIESESTVEEIRREALLTAAELYQRVDNNVRALTVFRRYVDYFPHPLEVNLETRSKIAAIFKQQDERKSYLAELQQIVTLDAKAAEDRTDRTRYLAAGAALVLAEIDYADFVAVKLVKPFETNLRKKQKLMKSATQVFGKLLDYEVGEVTAAATYYLAEIYAHFSRALLISERPDNLNALELEQYELAIEEQAYPFEERAISVHESNLELLALGIYNVWIDKSLAKLAAFVPARYAKAEQQNEILVSLEAFSFIIDQPVSAEQPQQPNAGTVSCAQQVGSNPTEVGSDVVVEMLAQAETGSRLPAERKGQ